MGGRLFIGAWATCRWLHNWGKKITCPNNCWLSIVFHGGMGSHGLLSFPIHGESLRVQSRVSLAWSGTVSCRVYATVVLSPECVSLNITVASHSSNPSAPPPGLQCSLNSVHPSTAMLPELRPPLHCNAPWAPNRTAISSLHYLFVFVNLFKINLLHFMCMGILPAGKSVHQIHTREVQQRTEKA